MYLNDAWDDIVELQQGMRCNQESIVNVVGDLKILLDNVDGSTSWDSVSMKEKGAKITNIAILLKIFQQQLRNLVECKEISDPGSGLSSVGSNEVSA